MPLLSNPRIDWAPWYNIAHSLISSERPWANRSGSLICLERPVRFAHDRSFPLSDVSDSLMVAHFLWAMWAIRSRLLICLERSEQIALSRSFYLSKMSKWANKRWANERIPSPEISSKFIILKALEEALRRCSSCTIYDITCKSNTWG